MASANAYRCGRRLPRLDTGAQIVLTGRVADPSLFLPGDAPLRLALRRLAAARSGTAAGHLLSAARR
jgi:hypothetical protein